MIVYTRPTDGFGQGSVHQLRHALVLACVLVLLGRSQLQAQPLPQERSKEHFVTIEGVEWEYRDAGSHRGSVWGGLLASTVGLVVHGVGHLYSGDNRTGTILMVGEGVGLGLMLGGLLTERFSVSSSGLAALYRPLTVIGSSLFISTWLFDVIGTFKGTRQVFPEQARSHQRMGFFLEYMHLFQEGFPLHDVVQARVLFDFDWIFIEPRSSVGINHDYLSFGATTGLRFGVGRRPKSFMSFVLDGEEVILDGLGYAYEALVLKVGLSLDLGDVFAHLDGLVYRNQIGYGTQLMRYEFDGSAPLNADNSVNMLVVEVDLNLDLMEGLHLEVGYYQRPGSLLGNLSQSMGAFFARLEYTLFDSFEIHLDGRVGRGLQILSGVGFSRR